MTMIGFSRILFGWACRGGTGGRLSSRRRTFAGNRSLPLKYLTVTVALPEGSIASAGALFLSREGDRAYRFPVIHRQSPGTMHPDRHSYRNHMPCTLRSDPGCRETCQVPLTRFVRKREDPGRGLIRPQADGTGNGFAGARCSFRGNNPGGNRSPSMHRNRSSITWL